MPVILSHCRGHQQQVACTTDCELVSCLLGVCRGLLVAISLAAFMHNTALSMCSGHGVQTTFDQTAGTTAAGLFSNSPRSESFDDFADAEEQGHHSSHASSASATTSSFHTAPSAANDNSSGSEEEGRRSSRGRRRGAGLAGVLGSPSPPRQSRFARFVSSAAAVTGLNAGDSSAQQEALAREKASKLSGKDGSQSELTQPTAGELSVTAS